MIDAIESTGVTVEEYNTIYTDAQTDPELADRISLALRERLGDRPPGG